MHEETQTLTDTNKETKKQRNNDRQEQTNISYINQNFEIVGTNGN